MKRKLIEVALPLEAINDSSAEEKAVPRRGHPATLHIWWARRPLAACRAVLFASVVDDPSSHPELYPTEAEQDRERERLFRLIEQLVRWENSNNQAILGAAREEILKCTNGKPPLVYDPFCGGGTIPLEAQRLGLETHASDLNPVAVLITKALIEIPPKFAGRSPVNPAVKGRMSGPGLWTGARGLAEDVLYYGKWMKSEAERAIGHFYPSVPVPRQYGGGELTPIAWIWARSVVCPNPACRARTPLARSFVLSQKSGRKIWIEPLVEHSAKRVSFEIRTGSGTPPQGTVSRRGAKCIICGDAVSLDHIRSQGQAGMLGSMLMAIVTQGDRNRIYINPTDRQAAAALSASAPDAPDTTLPDKALGFRIQRYGFHKFTDLFTPRQLLALTTFSRLIGSARQRAIIDGASEDYANALTVFLAFTVDKLADWGSALCTWINRIEGVQHTFARNALPMVWDYVEINPFSDSVGNFENHLNWVADGINGSVQPGPSGPGLAQAADAAELHVRSGAVFCTDPPYYDNIGYADLSDFFYIWLRRSLAPVYPELFSTLLVPKAEEIVASPERFGGDKEKAQEFFKRRFGQAFSRIASTQDPIFPLTLFYAFKQSEGDEDETDTTVETIVSTGWETMLEGLMRANLQITGTWPIRSERTARTRNIDSNALASSIVLVCRARLESAATTTRKDFLVTLKRDLPQALRDLQKGNIAPVDLAQAAVGPGMAVFSRYQKVLESDGTPMRVRTALALINQTLDEVLSEQEGDFDSDTRWALAWFEQNQFAEGLYGQAEVLATAKAVAISGLVEAGIVNSRAGKVRLLRREELLEEWDPATSRRLTVWEVTQHLIRCLDKRGEQDTAALKMKIGGLAETARELAYRLYTLCERKGWAEEAGYYNSLVVAWPAISQVPELFR
jgi:putative DNA methylase